MFFRRWVYAALIAAGCAPAPGAVHCGPETCSGCCSGETCITTLSDTSCGLGGAACLTCFVSQKCNVSGECVGGSSDAGCTPSCQSLVCGQDNGCGGRCEGCARAGETCNKTTWSCEPGCSMVRGYPDVDGDGWGDALAPGELMCAPLRAGFTQNHTDCADRDSRAHPGQTTFFTTPIVGPTELPLQFDFDCSGAQEEQYVVAGGNYCYSTSRDPLPAYNECTKLHAPPQPTWTQSIPPACGESGFWLTACDYKSAAGCIRVGQNQAQGCR